MQTRIVEITTIKIRFTVVCGISAPFLTVQSACIAAIDHVAITWIYAIINVANVPLATLGGKLAAILNLTAIIPARAIKEAHLASDTPKVVVGPLACCPTGCCANDANDQKPQTQYWWSQDRSKSKHLSILL
jgi:hypothetical protein